MAWLSLSRFFYVTLQPKITEEEMVLSIITTEALAHYMRGAVAMSFIFWSINLHVYAHRNRMMKLLYVASLYLTFAFLKDMVFLIEDLKDNAFVNDIAILVDLVTQPLLCAFFLEATRPGFATTRRIAAAVVLQGAFIPLFLLDRSPWVFQTAYGVSCTMSLLTIVSVFVFSYKYRRYLSSNYSYMENIDVRWVEVLCVMYFTLISAYFVAFDSITWLSEALFNLLCIMVSAFCFVFAKKHLVVKDAGDAGSEGVEGNEDMEIEPLFSPYYEFELEAKLEKCMKDKVYLEPKLTLSDMANYVGTNKTYLSYFFNNKQKTTFYEYINAYRIEEACRIIDNITDEDRLSLAQIAQASGFNSQSTFSRYFTKAKGVTPGKYILEMEMRRLMEK